MRPSAPTDIFECHIAWGANCGPAALAAALGCQVAAVKNAVSPTGTFADRPFMGINDMKTAIYRSGAIIGQQAFDESAQQIFDSITMSPTPKVAMIQWRGPWELTPGAAATKRHWIAQAVLEDETLVFDVNEEQWITVEDWRDRIVPQLLPPHSNGWRVSWIAMVKR